MTGHDSTYISRGCLRVFVGGFGLWVALKGLAATSKTVALSPSEFFRRLPGGGGYASPLNFALAWGLLAYAAGGFWNFVVPGSSPTFFVATLLASPFVVLTNLVLVAVAVHLLVRRSTGGENAGFGATFGVCCYASVGNVLCLIPFVGFYAAGVWFLFLVAVGIGRVHFEKGTSVKLLGGVPLVAAFAGFLFSKILIVAILYSALVGIVLTGSPAGTGEADSEVLLSIVMPGTGRSSVL